MVQVSPNTITGGDNGSGYSYEHRSIEGFAFTQMSGVGWFGELGNFLTMPTTGPLKKARGTMENPEDGYRSRYDKESETASAGYYSVNLADYDIKTEMTVAPHSGILRFTFPEHDTSRIQIDLARRVGGTSTMQYVKVVNDSTIRGWMKNTPEGGGWGNGQGKADYTVYFYATFSKPLRNVGVWSADIHEDWSRKRESVMSEKYQNRIANATVERGVAEKKGEHLGFFSEFETSADEEVLMKAGISFLSMEGARKNLQKEISGWDFDRVRQQAVDLWNEALDKIQIQGGTEDQKTIFYTALYHSMMDPRKFEDVDGQYIGGDKQPHTSENFTKRTVFSGWDVFRSQFPLKTLINPQLINDTINSMLTLADETDRTYLPRWEIVNSYSGCMIGNPAVSVLADAYAKGIRDYDVPKAYEYAKNTVEKFGTGEKGYVSGGLSISLTLEYAYTEWCMSSLAGRMNKPDDQVKYQERSKNYTNIYDEKVDWFRPRNENGEWMDWPEEGRLKQDYGSIESNLYQQGWFVPHDIDGMVELMGGREKVLDDLKTFFEKVPEDMMWNNYYNHANEPVHHVAFLFNRLGAPWLTQKWTRTICDKAYKNKVEGLVGNEDAGQMSAWYVLASIGIHPVNPGDPRYEITSPVFDEATLKVGKAGDKTFTIRALNNSPENIYIQKAILNGEEYNKNYINHEEIASDGTLTLHMGPAPNKGWGTK